MTRLHSGLLTYQDYRRFPDDGKRREIIHGELSVIPAPVPRHQRIVRKLLYLFESHLKQTQAGEVFTAPIDVVLSEHDIVQPDLLVAGKDQSDIVGDKYIAGAPCLVVEVVSETSRKMDYINKRKRYETFGVKEYWVVDPIAEQVDVFERQRGKLEKTGEHHLADTVVSNLIHGMTVPVREIF